MAPKRAAKKAAPPPPPPPPPAESSDDETRSSSDESEDEEAIADSPVRAPISTLKNAPAPSHKGGESESSSSEEEDDEDDEEEEEDQPVRAPPTSQPPPPQEKEDSDTSGSDEEEEEEEPAPKKQPPPAPKNQHRDDSDASYEEEEEEEVVPPPKPTPNKDLKPPGEAADKAKKPGPFHRIWSTDDEIRILESLAAHHKEHGTLPQTEDLLHGLNGKLDNPSYASKDLQSKVKSLRTRYLTLSKRPELPTKEHDRLVLDLSKIIWGHGGRKTATRAVATRAVASNGQETKGFEEMCELYPYLTEEVKVLEAVHPGMCKRGFGKMDDGKARAMDEKIKRQRVAQIKLEMRRADLAKEVAKALVDLVCG